MKILIMCNIMLPIISEIEQKEVEKIGGWLDVLPRKLIENNFELFVCFPYSINISKKSKNISYQSFNSKINNTKKFAKIIEKFNPDIIHIFGTEFSHTYEMTIAAMNKNKIDYTIISLQGITSYIFNRMNLGLPLIVKYGMTIHDIVRLNNPFFQCLKMRKNSKYEKRALNNISHVIGRTNWDKKCALSINKNLNYYHCNEILRSVFYYDKWRIEECSKYRIFISQYNQPLKGFHFMLKAANLLVNKYDNIQIYVVGNNVYEKRVFRITTYDLYIIFLIWKYKLKNRVHFLGELNAKEMKTNYLKSNVFVSCSTIENSSNSIGEAMMLGVPIVASNVGGTNSMVINRKTGLLYEYNDVQSLAYCIKEIFDHNYFSCTLSRNETIYAKKVYNITDNMKTLETIYEKVSFK